jgi:hypothetical protein
MTDNLRRRYRYSLVVMLAGWLMGLSAFALFYFYAKRAARLANGRAQAIWSDPRGVKPADLPEEVRLALLALIATKMRPHEKLAPPGPPPGFKPVPWSPTENARDDLVPQFLGKKEPSALKFVIPGEGDTWIMLLDSEFQGDWPDDPGDPGDEWWFIDPATGQTPTRSVSDIEAEEERFAAGLGVATAALFSLPWLWFFTLAWVPEISGTVHAMARRRRIATFVMVLGPFAAGATLAFGGFEYQRASQRLSALHSQCESERKDFLDFNPISLAKGEIPPWEVPLELVGDFSQPGLRCEPEEIERLAAVVGGPEEEGVVSTPNKPLLGIQREILKQVRAREHDWDDAKSWALVVALILAIPWGWYFLLGRIEELIAAIRGTDRSGE